MLKNPVFFALILLFCSGMSFSQQSSCMTDFDFVIAKIKSNYPGYNDKIKGDKVEELARLEQDLRRRIALHPDSCGYYLSEYAGFFKDEHLRVRRVPGPDKEWVQMDISSYGKNIAIDTNEMFARTTGSNTIEGLWVSWCGEIAVIKDPGKKNYLGVSVSYTGWKPGQVMFEFAPLEPDGMNPESHPPSNDTLFKVKEHTTWQGARVGKTKASLHVNRNILEVYDVRFFVRKSSFQRSDYAMMKSYVPLYPNGQNTYFTYGCLSDSTFFMRIPGFDGNKERIESTLKDHWSDIMSRPNLVIDLRNNGGGQDDEWQMLFRLLYTGPFFSKGVEWYACEDNIKGYEDDLKKGTLRGGDEGIKWTMALLAEMKKHPGEFVIHPMMGKDETVKEDTVYKYPRQVGIIINENNGSSAEQFLLAAKTSSKVTLFGNTNTAGVLDYSNSIPIDLPSGKYYMRYPMSRSRRLPENPIDNIGISPDVIIPYPATEQLLDKQDIWVEYVKDWLEAGGK
ncbi:MAG: S41 family peptidase [Bacteroidetes bacterium]|nr:S41 family peptidase [Bacteroidota bacterium]